MLGVATLAALLVSWLTVDRDGSTDTSSTSGTPHNRPIEKPDFGYVGSDACRSCHPHEYKTWHASYHRTMTQVPKPSNVVADFENVILETKGKNFHLQQRDGQFWVEMDDTDPLQTLPAPRVTRQIVLMTGSHHEQDFWYETGFGRGVGRLPFVYRLAEQRWIPDVSVFLTPPGAGAFGRWNTTCINCHTTLGRPRIRGLGMADTEVVEFGISCEACHGPGEGHARRYRELQEASPLTTSAGSVDAITADEIINPSKLEPHRASEVCGQCHARYLVPSEEQKLWSKNGFSFRPGQKLADSRIVIRASHVHEQPEVLRLLKDKPDFLKERFWPDGMVRVIGSEYTGLIESPCFQRGDLTCLSCHRMHPDKDDPRPLKQWANDQLQDGTQSNQACLQCHSSVGEQLEAHTHHSADSVGSRCYNCHMPPTTYGLLKAVHSHHIDSPSLTPSLSAGRPNACNLCHLDKSLEWTNEHLTGWYDIERKQLTDLQSGVPASVLWALRGHAGQRALMAWAMGWPPAQQASGKNWQGRVLSQLLQDPYDAVRFIAYRSLRTLPGFKGFQYDFLQDPPARKLRSKRALADWVDQRKSVGKSIDLTELLKAPAGSTPAELFDLLLSERDDRRIRWTE